MEQPNLFPRRCCKLFILSSRGPGRPFPFAMSHSHWMNLSLHPAKGDGYSHIPPLTISFSLKIVDSRPKCCVGYTQFLATRDPTRASNDYSLTLISERGRNKPLQMRIHIPIRNNYDVNCKQVLNQERMLNIISIHNFFNATS